MITWKTKGDWENGDEVGGEGYVPESVSIDEAKQAIRRRIAEIQELAATVEDRIEFDYAPEPKDLPGINGGEPLHISTEEYQRHEFGHVLRNLMSAAMHLDDVEGC